MSFWKKLRAEVPGAFLAALALGGGFLLFVAWDQSHWWRVKQDYQFGWLVPALVGFVIYDRWPRILAALGACAAEGSPRVAGWQKWTLGTLVGLTMAFGALMFLLGSFYRAGAGTSQPGTLAITMGAVAILLPLLWINAPEPGFTGSGTRDHGPEIGGLQPANAGGVLADARWRLAGLFVFPVMVWLVSAPMVSAIESQISLFLLRQVVTVVAFVFVDVLGLPIEQQGNVLALPGGNVGVEDACSGIRSLTASLFAGSFLAAVFLEKIWKKVTLVVVSMVFVFLANLGRSLFLTAWAYHKGPRAIEGAVHDVAGYGVLGVTFGGLVALVWVLNLKLTPEKIPPRAELEEMATKPGADLLR